jgi:protein-S-isoprenylcysteine O-methyltransferase Ste14
LIKNVNSQEPEIGIYPAHFGRYGDEAGILDPLILDFVPDRGNTIVQVVPSGSGHFFSGCNSILTEDQKMSRKLAEPLGLVINGLSIALFFWLSTVLRVPNSLRFLRYPGWVFLVLGMTLIALSIQALTRNKGRGVIDRGVFGIVRHPMYLGSILCYLAFSFFVPHGIMILISVVNAAICYGFMVQGERQNLEKFGDDYRRYMEKVPRVNPLSGIFRRRDES